MALNQQSASNSKSILLKSSKRKCADVINVLDRQKEERRQIFGERHKRYNDMGTD